MKSNQTLQYSTVIWQMSAHEQTYTRKRKHLPDDIYDLHMMDAKYVLCSAILAALKEDETFSFCIINHFNIHM